MLIDSHCHLDQLDLTEYQGDLAKAIAYAKEVGVTHMLNVCIDIENFPKVLEIAKSNPNIYASVGKHPNDREGHDPTLQELLKYAEDKTVIAIGETGLDYYRTEGDVLWQQERFRRHIQAALKSKKPLIIHTRQAQDDTVNILKEENAAEIGGVFHCFTEDWLTAKKALDLGFYISFSGIITFKNAEILRDVVKEVPLEKMLIETDSPYLAPMPYRGKSNQPAYVYYVAKKIAELKNISFEKVCEVTSENFLKLFKL